jgi:uncharacterized RDD family membrane protein YckC
MEKQETAIQIDFNHWILRLIAWVIDAIIVIIPTYIIYTFAIASALRPTYSGYFYTYYGAVPWWGTWFISPLVFGIIAVVYCAVLDTAWGATIGKRLLGFKVQTTSGGKVDIGKAIIRNISKIFWILLILDWLIGIVTPGNDKRQKYSDRIAQTTVVQTKQSITTSAQPKTEPTTPPTTTTP